MNCNSNTIPLIGMSSQVTCNNGCTPKDISVVCRKIIVPTGQEILGVQGDTGSISRIFLVPKTTEEGYDLSDKIFRMIVENIEGEQWEEIVPTENIEILENYIKLKWNLISKDTQYSGELKVSIKASKDNFIWQTYIASFEIQPSLIQPEDIKVPLNLQDKTVEPNDKVQVITYDEGYDGLNSVTVDGSEDLQPENIVVGKTIFNIEGTFSADGDTTSSDLIQNKIAYSNGKRIVGTLEFPKIIDASYFFLDGRRLGGDYTPAYYVPLFGKVITTTYMFYSAKNLKEVDLVGLDTSECIDMSHMFDSSSSRSINLGGFNTGNVTNMSNMFYNCSELENLDVSSFDTSNVTNMNAMFSNCYTLTSLDLSSFDTNKVAVMGAMFNNCYNLISLDLSNFNTKEVTGMGNMFFNCTNLEEIKFGENFDTSNVTYMYQMFSGSNKLVTLPQFNAGKVNYVQNMFISKNLTNFGGLLDLGKGYTQKSKNYSPYQLTLSTCTKLTHDSLMNVINGLYDLNLTYDVAGGGTLYTQTLNLGTTNKAKLTADEIAIATNKGWNVA